jgi:hypothetical protein
MSKLVNWGHWLVGGAFAALGLLNFYQTVLFAPNLVEDLRNESSSFFFLSSFVLWIPQLASAWGLWKWKSWGYELGLAQVVLGVFWCSWWLAYVGTQNVGMRGAIRPEHIVALLICLCILGWLMLPAVRHQYRRKVAAA